MAYRFLLENQFKQTEKTESVLNPYTGEKVGEYFKASVNDFDKSINYLKEAYIYYSKLPVYTKKALLFSLAHKIAENKDQISKLITDETGKPIKFSLIETERAILTFRLGAELSSEIIGEVLSLDLLRGSEEKTAFVRRFPYGIILGITPWNFPLNLIAHKVSPALASSNVILIKPASASSLTGIKLAEMIYEACNELDMEFLPFNLLTLSGSETNDKLSDENIKIISFTGSSEIGWNIKRKAYKQKVLLELGGNAGVIVNDDADLELSISKIILGGFAQAGQSCIAIQRVYVHRKIYDDFRQKLIEETAKVKFGNPYDAEVICGPMINENEAIRAELWIKEAVALGSRLLTGGGREKAVLEPTVIENVPDSAKVKCEEVFAPVITIEKFNDFKEAVIEINNSKYGLQAAIFTDRMSDIKYAFEKIETGGVVINDTTSYRMDSMPYGGVKSSGNTREGVKYAIREMTEEKTLIL